ncbi:MAG: hypothetical protein QW696_00425 [Candidatus Micrarchaeaceae archaeon]
MHNVEQGKVCLVGDSKGIVDKLKLLERKDLTSETHMKNDYEAVFKDVLLEFKGNGVEAYYELFTFPLQNKRGYLPDFTTNLTVDGKLVIIEEHASLDAEFLEKIGEFRDRYKIYMIVGTKSTVDVYTNQGLSMASYMDEFWYVPNNIKANIEAKTSKDALRSHINELMKKVQILDRSALAEVLYKLIRNVSPNVLAMAKN